MPLLLNVRFDLKDNKPNEAFGKISFAVFRCRNAIAPEPIISMRLIFTKTLK